MGEIISWKGKTFDQISSSIKKNQGNNSAEKKKGIFKANPLKIYRRELSSLRCNQRTSISLDNINAPGGVITNSKATEQKGITTVLDFNLTENKYERPGLGNCNNPSSCFNQAQNAKNRVRSSGMIKKKFNLNKNNDHYYTSTNQYLASRNKKFDQNQFYNIRLGDATATPGTNSSLFNVYATNSLSKCKKYAILNNTSFKYKWIDGTDVTVSIPSGNYDIHSIQDLLVQTMADKGHYYLKNENQNKIFLLSISYVVETNKSQVNTRPGGKDIYPTDTNQQSQSGEYSVPKHTLHETAYFTNPDGEVMPQFIFDNTDIKNLLGLVEEKYPLDANITDTSKSNQTHLSPNPTMLKSSYVPVYYKPSNSKFANQGAVESSSRTVRLKYDSITNSTVAYRNELGSSVANALAYGVPGYGYTIKDKIGYPNKCTPKFPKKCKK